MTIAYISVGSNLGDPLNQVTMAIKLINQLPNICVINQSSFYRTTPLGPKNQLNYLNAVMEIKTSLKPIELLNELQQIELTFGRVRKDERWGPRTLDLDIILFDNITLQNDRLTIPHYDMHNREFVLLPLFEIAPGLVLPNGVLISELIQNLKIKTLTKWNE